MRPARLPMTLILTGVVALASCALAGYLVGVNGAWSAALAVGIVVVFFGSTPLVVGPIATALPQYSLAAAMLFYLTKVVALLVLFMVLAGAGAAQFDLHRESLAFTVIATSFAWIIGRIRDAVTARIPIYDLPEEQ